MMVTNIAQMYRWVQNMDSANRIDFMCSVLEQYCAPWELRFFGSCIESLARKDYSTFIDPETKANDIKELRLLNNLNLFQFVHGEHTRSRLITYLCLFRSKPRDTSCTMVFYEILVSIGNHLKSLVNDSQLCSVKLIEDIRLLHVMAMHHPAFSFEQRRDFNEKLGTFVHMLEQITGNDYSSSPGVSDAQCQTDSGDIKVSHLLYYKDLLGVVIYFIKMYTFC